MGEGGERPPEAGQQGHENLEKLGVERIWKLQEKARSISLEIQRAIIDNVRDDERIRVIINDSYWPMVDELLRLAKRAEGVTDEELERLHTKVYGK